MTLDALQRDQQIRAKIAEWREEAEKARQQAKHWETRDFSAAVRCVARAKQFESRADELDRLLSGDGGSSVPSAQTERIIADMQRANRFVENADGPAEYQRALVTLGLLARTFLRFASLERDRLAGEQEP